MARYIDGDALLEKLSRMIGFCEKHKMSGLNALFQVGDAIMDCPTADVIPKEFLTRKEDEAYERGYAEGKTEVAREIFEEIERFLYMHFRFCKEEIGNDDTKYFEGRLELNTQMQDFIAELKKKYLEGSKEAEK